MSINHKSSRIISATDTDVTTSFSCNPNRDWRIQMMADDEEINRRVQDDPALSLETVTPADDGSDTDDDAWDDRLLQKEYLASIKKVEDALRKKNSTFQEGNSSTLLTDNPKDNLNPGSSSTKPTPNGIHSRKAKLQFVSTILPGTSSKSPSYSIGSHCRAVFSADGLEYEAVVEDISDDDTCRVRYYGYGNEEVVKMSELKASKGKVARNLQKMMAETEAKSRSSAFEMPSSATRIPPPPPPSVLSDHRHPDEDDALSSMLMSWYMSGYHTGYYSAMKKYKKNDDSQ